jgi:hypothetical protein
MSAFLFFPSMQQTVAVPGVVQMQSVAAWAHPTR